MTSTQTKSQRTGRATGTKRSSRPKDGSRHDGIVLLREDHEAVEALFKKFEQAGDRAHKTKRKLVDSMIEELSRHAALEELVFYPAVRAEVDDVESDVLEALEEHHVVKLVLHELEDLDAEDERFDAKVTVMIENVRHHVEEEEQELFPAVRSALDRNRLLEIGDVLRESRSMVPSRPHPRAPDEPPGNVLVGGVAAVVDRARHAGKQAVQRIREEVPGT